MKQIPDAAVQAAKRELRYSTGDWEHDICRALTAALPHLPLGYEVKQLSWSQKAPPVHDHEPFTYWAAGVGGHYKAEPDGMLWFAHDAFVWEQFTSQAEAKAAAQADFERRVRECIVANPVYAHGTSFEAYMHIVEFFDKDGTAGSFLNEDGEGGFLSAIDRMAREIDRLRATKPVDVAAVREQCAQIAERFTNREHITHDMKAGIFPSQSKTGVAIAAAIRAHSPAVPTDRLLDIKTADCSKQIIGWGRRVGFHICYHNGKQWQKTELSSSFQLGCEAITHWIPLPAAPTTDAGRAALAQWGDE